MLGKKELPFGKYKQYLIDYLRMQGVEAREGQVMNCPWHEDSTPSFSVFHGESGELAFNCFGCGRAGDIYKAVEYCTGETDAKKQFEEVERIFGNGESVASTFVPASSEKEEPTFTPDPEAFKRLTDWLKTQTTDERIRHYFSQRMLDKTLGQSDSYPEEVLKNAVPFFYYWPGATTRISSQATLAVWKFYPARTGAVMSSLHRAAKSSTAGRFLKTRLSRCCPRCPALVESTIPAIVISK